MFHAQASALTALAGATKTLIDTITIPAKATKIVGIWGYVHEPGMTTLEMSSGILELESDDVTLNPMQLPLECVTATTSGAIAYQPRILPCDIPVSGGSRIRGYGTLDMALATAEKARFGLLTE